jgi:hypothetical protein
VPINPTSPPETSSRPPNCPDSYLARMLDGYVGSQRVLVLALWLRSVPLLVNSGSSYGSGELGVSGSHMLILANTTGYQGRCDWLLFVNSGSWDGSGVNANGQQELILAPINPEPPPLQSPAATHLSQLLSCSNVRWIRGRWKWLRVLFLTPWFRSVIFVR